MVRLYGLSKVAFMLKLSFCGRVARGLISAAALAGTAGFAQEAVEKPARPRIGLVLEGVGALGFAHIGVLEWMEQHHIPVDDIAGTSMGGLVGGLYAMGESPSE